jgi:hypothetical protein
LGEISKDIIVWDYVIQFNNLISPFPNLHVLKPNIQFFASHGVNAMFEQGNREVGGEFAELRAYLLSKLLWNPEANVDTLTERFSSRVLRICCQTDTSIHRRDAKRIDSIGRAFADIWHS